MKVLTSSASPPDTSMMVLAGGGLIDIDVDFDFTMVDQVRKAGVETGSILESFMYLFYMFVFIDMIVVLYNPRSVTKFGRCDFIFMWTLFGHRFTRDNATQENRGRASSSSGNGKKLADWTHSWKNDDRRRDDDDDDDDDDDRRDNRHDSKKQRCGDPPVVRCGKKGCKSTLARGAEGCIACGRSRCVLHLRNGNCENCFMVTICDLCETVMTINEGRMCACGFEGDWFCPDCGEYQFSRNSECRSCHRRKSDLD